MIQKRNISYDYLRAFSAIMIVLCHICQGYGISECLSFYLGGTYVSVFLLLSSYLLGLKHRNTITENPLKFMKSRLKRLVPSYYVFLAVSFVLISIFIGFLYLSPGQVIGHILFLNWFVPSFRIHEYPLPQLGHLWFMCCIVFCYILITIMAFAPTLCKKSHKYWIAYMMSMIVVGIIICNVSKIFIYPMVVIAFFPPIFYRGREIMSIRFHNVIMVILLIVFNVGAIIAYQFGMRDYPSLVFISISVNAFLWIACAPIIFAYKKIPVWVGFISAISFEIYLVHHAFCLGQYSLSRFMPNYLAIPICLILSILLGYILKKLTDYVSNFIDYIKNYIKGKRPSLN